MKLKFFLVIYYLSALIAWQCAALGLPGGGAKDSTPPELLSADPPSGTVGLSSHEIVLSFSEYMDEKSFEKGIRIAPVLIGELGLNFKGKKIIITLPEDINTDITVVLTLSREIKDEHGVELSKSFQLAYSFGENIDNGSITGNVYADQSAALYLFHDDGSDTILLSSPDYISEAADNGSFAFNYLAPGSYQILAIDRGVAGAKLDPFRMAHGVSSTARIILDSLQTGIHLKLHLEEKPLRLLRGEWNDWDWGKIYFNKELSQEISFSNLKIGSKELDWFISPDDLKAVVVTTNDSLNRPKESISFSGIRLNNLVILDSSSVNVSIPSMIDTNSFSLIKPDPEVSVTPDKTGPPLEFIFSRPVGNNILNKYDAALLFNDSIDVLFERNITTPMSMMIVPKEGWKPKSSYTFHINNLDSGNIKYMLKDSITTIKISTNQEQGYGGLSGIINGVNGNIIAEINHTENVGWEFKSVVNSAGYFEFIDVPEGKYTISLFEDKDNNFAYSHGKAFPFQPSEWFYVSNDTIEIRANWDIELSPIYLEK
ncbi:MAG: Ig-like domain-containing protein [Fidelibacterota bacterium]